MKIGILFAEEKELHAFLENCCDDIKKDNVYELTIYKTKYKKNEVIFVQCNIGKVNAGRTTQILIDKYNVDLILNAGVCGCVDKNLAIGDVVLGKYFYQYDYDLTEYGRKYGEIPNCGKFIECNNKYLKLLDLPLKKVASADKFLTRKDYDLIEMLNKDDVSVVDMESASISQVCYLCKVDYVIIRGISDNVFESNNQDKFYEMLESVSLKVSKYLYELLDKIGE